MKSITVKQIIKMYKDQNIFVTGGRGKYSIETHYDMGGIETQIVDKAKLVALALKDMHDYGWVVWVGDQMLRAKDFIGGVL